MDIISQINIQFVSAVISCIVNLSIAAVVFIKNRKNVVHLTLSLVSISMAIWHFGDMFTYFPGIRNPLKAYIIHTGLVMLVVFSLHFILNLLRRNKGINRILLFVYYVLGLAGLIISWTPLSLSKNTPVIMAILMFPIFFYEFWMVLDGIQKSTSAIGKNRLKYIAAAIGVMLVGGLSEYLPYFGIPSYRVGLLTGAFYSFIMAFAILKYNLLDIRIVTGRTLVLAILTTMVGSIYLLVVFICSNSPELLYATLIIFSFVVIITIPWIKKRVYNTLQGVLFREKYKYHDIIGTFSSTISTIIDLDELISTITNKVYSALKLKSISVFVIDRQGLRFKSSRSGVNTSNSILIPSQIPGFLRIMKKGKIITKNMLDMKTLSIPSDIPENLHREMELTGGEVFVPIGKDESFKGFIAMDDSIVSSPTYFEDLELLKNVAGQLAIAINNTEMYTQMKHKDRLSVLGTMAAGIAHEVKNPLSSIKSAAQNLKEEIKDENKQYFDIILEEVERLDKTVTDLLQYARPGENRLEQYNIARIIDNTISIAGEGAGERISFTKNYPEGFADNYIKPDHLKQILLNLLINAVAAIEGTGEINTAIENITVDNKKYMELRVKDTGCGILGEHLNKVFQPFFTKKEKGSGLGLAVVNSIVEGYNGSISIQSVPDKGTEIIVLIPVK